MIGEATIKNSKAIRKQNLILKNGYCQPCFSRTINLCYKQIAPATTFKRNATLKTYQIFYQLNYKDSYIIYLLECLKCQLQNAGKAETKFNIRLKNHRKEVIRRDIRPASNYFDIKEQSYNINVKFIFKEQLNQTNLDKLTLLQRLKIRENLWILKLDTLHPRGQQQNIFSYYPIFQIRHIYPEDNFG